MFDLKVMNSALGELEEERGIDRNRMLEAVEQALATAYKKEFGKRGQIIRAAFNIETGDVDFTQVKIVVDDTMVRFEEEDEKEAKLAEQREQFSRKPEPEVNPLEMDEEGRLPRFDAEKHMLIEDARRIKGGVELSEEIVFPLEHKDNEDFGRIAAQTAKQVIIQKVREAEKESALTEFGQKEGDVVMGHVQRFERGNLYVDLGRVTAVMPYDEQIPGERYRTGERIRAILLAVEETPRGIFLKLSRAHPDFLEHLFAIETPELQTGMVEVKAIAREAGSRSKIAVHATEEHIDPVGSLVGQRGVRVSTVMSELGGEKIDIIEWSESPEEFIEESLSPAQIIDMKIEQQPDAERNERGHAVVEVAPDQQSLAIGRGGQNVRLAAKLTGWKIDIHSVGGEDLAEADEDGNVEISDEATDPETVPEMIEAETVENEEGTTEKPAGVDPLDDADEDTKDRDVVSPDRNEVNQSTTPETFEDQMAEAEATDEIEQAEEETTNENKATDDEATEEKK